MRVEKRRKHRKRSRPIPHRSATGRCVVVAALLLSLPAAGAGPATNALTAVEILERLDANFMARNRRSTSSMIIRGRRGTRTVRSQSWIQGNEKAFTEYLAPPREKGTKMLKLGDELWTWTPATDRIIKIAGHMLRQAVMGSDLSYEDFMEDPVLHEIYTSEVTGEEPVEGRPCYVLTLRAAAPGTAYHSRKLWIDKQWFLAMREELFARSGKLLKVLHVHEVFKQDDRWYPKRMTFKDVLKRGEGTELVLESIEFDIEIPEHVFSKAALRR